MAAAVSVEAAVAGEVAIISEEAVGTMEAVGIEEAADTVEALAAFSLVALHFETGASTDLAVSHQSQELYSASQ